MTPQLPHRSAVATFAIAFLAVLGGASDPGVSGTVTLSKDVGPTNVRCDHVMNDASSWRTCIGVPVAAMPSAELFYAGYWLAKSGAYREALSYLNLADKSEPRVLTYIGFATRKLGDVDAALPYYRKALIENPNYSVARAYLGEAFLAKKDLVSANGQLLEIETRCGTTCAEYAVLKAHIGDYENGRYRG